MSCFNCDTAFQRFYLTQNPMDRLCSACNKHTCILCARESHFPSSCIEMQNHLLENPEPVHLSADPRFDKIKTYADFKVRRDQLLVAFDTDTMISHPEVPKLFDEVANVCQILINTEISSLQNQVFSLGMATAILHLSKALEIIFNVLPQPNTSPESWQFADERTYLHETTQYFLMTLLEAREVLGVFGLLECVPNFPPRLLASILADCMPHIPRPDDVDEFYDITARFLRSFYLRVKIDPIVSYAGQNLGNHRLLEELSDVTPLIDNDTPLLNMTFSVYAEAFLWTVSFPRS